MVLEKLTEIFCDVFEDDTLILHKEMSAKDIEKWDSFNHISLMIALEDSFSVTLNPKDIEHLTTVEDIVKLLDVDVKDLDW